MLEPIAVAAAFVFGLLIGSFLNVCIYRWPLDLSVVTPRSQCPHCNAPIAWYDNVPVLSYLLLRARCRACGKAISYRYPLVELLTAGFFAWIVAERGLSLDTLKLCILVAMLIALMFTDLEERILPDEFTLGGLLMGVVLSLFVPVPDSTAHMMAWLLGMHLPERVMSLAEALLGAILPAAVLWSCGWILGKLERYREMDVLGLGDVKMVAMIGAFLGVGQTLLASILGSLAGSIIGVIYILVTRKDWRSYPLPFGTFFAAAAILAAVAGPSMIKWYSRFL